MRWIAFISLSGCTAAAITVACSSDDTARAPFDEPDAPVSNLPDSGGGTDSSVDSAKVDMRPPFDPKDEAVLCGTTAPCAVQLVAGEQHFCARFADGTVRCWGDDSVGELGVTASADAGKADAGDGGDAGDAGAHVVPPVTGLGGTTQLSAGGTTTCALVEDGGVRCWGGNDTGQLGLKITPPVSDFTAHRTPTAVALGGAAASRIDVGQRTACALLSTGKTWCWGDNTQKELARTTTTDVGGPGEAVIGTAARTAAGTNTGFAVTTSGDVLSWGAVAGTEGSVAARTASVTPDPAPLTILTGPATSFAVSSTTVVSSGGGFPRPPPAGVAHACAVVKGDVMCWGVSLTGALATGLPDPAPKPTRAVVESEKGWPQQVAVAGDLTCVRLTDGTVQCAGENMSGTLAKDPETAPFSMFFEPAKGFTGHAVAVAAAAHSVCALTLSGAVMCWGSNEHRELGLQNADTDPHPTPLPIAF